MSSKNEPFDWTLNWAHMNRMRVWASEETASTNTVAKNDSDSATRPRLQPYPSASDVSLYITRRQVQGRGRNTRTWSISEGALFATWAFALPQIPQPIFAPLAGLALYEAAQIAWPSIAFNLKAPNDLYIGHKKTAGLLIETIDQAHEKRSVIGLGLNVMSSPPGIETAICLAHAADQVIKENAFSVFLKEWIQRLISALYDGLEEKLKPESCRLLKDALNKHPLLTEPILEVDPSGQLHSASRTIYWHEL